MLWTKLSREPKTRNYEVRIIDSRTGKYIPDENGNEIVYDATNIKESEIWAKDWDFEGENKLLVLTIPGVTK